MTNGGFAGAGTRSGNAGFVGNGDSAPLLGRQNVTSNNATTSAAEDAVPGDHGNTGFPGEGEEAANGGFEGSRGGDDAGRRYPAQQQQPARMRVRVMRGGN